MSVRSSACYRRNSAESIHSGAAFEQVPVEGQNSSVHTGAAAVCTGAVVVHIAGMRLEVAAAAHHLCSNRLLHRVGPSRQSSFKAQIDARWVQTKKGEE